MSLTDNIFDMIYYINLEKDEDRNNNMLKYFALFDIKNYKRIEGSVVDVDLSSIPNSVYRNFNRKDENYIKNALGCRLSHLKCIADAKQNNYKRILIFEDDVQFSKNLDDLLLGNYNNLHDFDMLYLGGLEEQLLQLTRTLFLKIYMKIYLVWQFRQGWKLITFMLRSFNTCL